MADAKPGQKPESTTKPKLAPASESSDPAVHQLLAQRQTAHMNEDTDELRRVNRELADLGYE